MAEDANRLPRHADDGVPEEPSDRFKRGMGLRRMVHGHDHVDAAWRAAEGDEQRRVLESYITDCLWGTLWSRNAIPSKIRSLVTIGLLIATRQERDLRLHIRSAVLRNQCSIAEVREVVLHTVAYCGIGTAVDAYEITAEVARELGQAKPDASPVGRRRTGRVK
jgi:4-carboxymuconolactone decarboxylase